MDTKKKKVFMYYSSSNMVGGPLTYLKTIMESPLCEKYDFVACFQDMAPGGLNMKLLKRMKNKISKERPDIVHVHGLQSEGFYGVLAAKMAGVRKIVTTVHGFAFDSQNSSKLKRYVYRYLVEPITLHMSDEVYCVCEYAAHRKIILRHVGNKCKYIYSSAPTLHLTQSRNSLRESLHFKEEDTVFVIAGRITKEKGFEILAQAVKLLKSRCSKAFKLLVLGDGDYSQEFQLLMKAEIEEETVVMIGRTDRVGDYLLASDVCILPSYHENLPIALLEAGMMGLPCIASAVGGIPEVVRDSVTGFLLNIQSPEAYAEKMELLIMDNELRGKMGESIRSDIARRFSLDEMCKKIEEIYG